MGELHTAQPLPPADRRFEVVLRCSGEAYGRSDVPWDPSGWTMVAWTLSQAGAADVGELYLKAGYANLAQTWRDRELVAETELRPFHYPDRDWPLPPRSRLGNYTPQPLPPAEQLFEVVLLCGAPTPTATGTRHGTGRGGR